MIVPIGMDTIFKTVIPAVALAAPACIQSLRSEFFGGTRRTGPVTVMPSGMEKSFVSSRINGVSDGDHVITTLSVVVDGAQAVMLCNRNEDAIVYTFVALVPNPPQRAASETVETVEPFAEAVARNRNTWSTTGVADNGGGRLEIIGARRVGLRR
jgi:hypothetical protein